MSARNTAMILAAGKGTRLSALTKSQPKALVKVNGVSLIERVIRKLENNGFEHFVINVHHFADQITEHLKQSKYQHLKIDISDESTSLLDTGGGILNARKYFENSHLVLVHNVDILSNLDLKSIIKDFEETNDKAWLLTQERKSSRKLLFDNDYQLVGWHHKEKNRFKWVDKRVSRFTELAFSGIHLFRPELFQALPFGTDSIIDLYLQLAKSNAVKSHEIKTDYWFDIGKIAEFDANDKFIQQLESK